MPRFGRARWPPPVWHAVGAGLARLGHVPPAELPASILPGLVLLGFGAGFSFVSITTAALAQVQESAAGSPPGCSAPRQIGGAVGLAVSSA